MPGKYAWRATENFLELPLSLHFGEVKAYLSFVTCHTTSSQTASPTGMWLCQKGAQRGSGVQEDWKFLQLWA